MSTETQTVPLDALRDVPLDNFPATLDGIVIDDVGLDGMTDNMLFLLGFEYTDPARNAATFATHTRSDAGVWSDATRNAGTFATHTRSDAGVWTEQTRTTATWTETRPYPWRGAFR